MSVARCAFPCCTAPHGLGWKNGSGPMQGAGGRDPEKYYWSFWCWLATVGAIPRITSAMVAPGPIFEYGPRELKLTGNHAGLQLTATTSGKRSPQRRESLVRMLRRPVERGSWPKLLLPIWRNSCKDSYYNVNHNAWTHIIMHL